jgi:hypothetical protein
VLVLSLLFLPIDAHAQVNKQKEGNLTKSLVKGDKPKKPLKQGISTSSISDYPLVQNGEYVTTLYDSWYTYHDITFTSVSSYSSSQMDVQINDSTDYAYAKDSIVTVEFYKDSGGYLDFVGSMDFDTYGYYSANLHSLADKSYYTNQPYIYLKVGISEYEDDEYYSDVTQFKVANPFYSAPPADKTPPNKPTVNAVSDASTTVTGKAESGSTVYVLSGSKTLGSATAGSNQAFSVAISKQKAGTMLSVYAKDKAGNKSSTAYVTVSDKTAPIKPTVRSVGDNQTVVIGTTEAKAKVTVYVGTALLGQGYANSSGQFVIKIKTIQKTDTVLTVYAYDSVGNKSYTTSKVVDKTPPKTPTVNKVTSLSTSISGKSEASTTIYIFNNGTLIGSGLTSSSGSFSVSIAKQTKGSKLEVCAMDKADNQSSMLSVTVY